MSLSPPLIASKKEVTDLKAEKSKLSTLHNILFQRHKRLLQNQSQSTPSLKKVLDKAQEDHKFNVVIYGIKECAKGMYL